MRDTFLPFCLPDITDAEIDEVQATLKSGWIAKGPRTVEFEKRFAEYVGAKYAIAMNSCTAALHIALLCAGIGEGDEVITTPMTFAATANTIVNIGATPVFVDIDPLTGCIDADKIEAAVTPRTKAIVPVHYSGQACDLDKIYAIADKYGLFVSEDAAHALYTRYKGRMIGNHPKGTVSYSFYATKNLSTGEGGMLVTDNEEIANKARVYSCHGMSRNAWNRYSKGGSWRYDIEEFGYKYNMFDIQAALGLIQLERFDDMQVARRKIVDMYQEGLADVQGIITPEKRDFTTNHCWHLYIIRVDKDAFGISRDELIEQLNEHNIGNSVHFIPLHLMSAYRNRFGYKEGDFPECEKWFDGILSLPLYSTMTERDAQDVIDAVKDIAAKAR